MDKVGNPDIGTLAKEYVKNHPPPKEKVSFTNRTRTVGGEFSPQVFLRPKQFKSEWDRERCQAPKRSYPSRIGAVSQFYNPLTKSDWRPTSTCPRKMSLMNAQAGLGYQEERLLEASAPVMTPPTVTSMCPGCCRFVIPYEIHRYGGCAAVSSVGLCFVTPLLALLPCCCNTFKDVIYVCPNCRTRLAHYKKLPI